MSSRILRCQLFQGYCRVGRRHQTDQLTDVVKKESNFVRYLTYGLVSGSLALFKVLDMTLSEMYVMPYESYLRSFEVTDRLVGEPDPGMIGFNSERNSFIDTPLSDENQARIIAYCDELIAKLKKTYGPGSYRIVPVVGMPYATGNDFFTVFAIRSPEESFLMKNLFAQLGFADFAGGDKIVLINVASLIEDVNLLKALYENTGLRFSGDYGQVYKYLRSTTTSPGQLSALTDLNLKLQEVYESHYPKGEILSLPFLMCLPLLGNSSLAVTTGALIMAPLCLVGVVDAALYGRYEQKKRDVIAEHFATAKTDDLPALLTHLYRIQDHLERSKEVKTDLISRLAQDGIGLQDSLAGKLLDSIKSVRTDVFKTQVTEETTDAFVSKMVSSVLEIANKKRLQLDVDPYEIYKDDEGYDYVFMG